MLIFAGYGSQYVGVYTCEERVSIKIIPLRDWDCKAYHDSCWRSEGVNRVLSELYREEGDICFSISFPFGVFSLDKVITDICAGVKVVQLTPQQIEDLRSVRERVFSR